MIWRLGLNIKRLGGEEWTWGAWMKMSFFRTYAWKHTLVRSRVTSEKIKARKRYDYIYHWEGRGLQSFGYWILFYKTMVTTSRWHVKIGLVAMAHQKRNMCMLNKLQKQQWSLGKEMILSTSKVSHGRLLWCNKYTCVFCLFGGFLRIQWGSHDWWVNMHISDEIFPISVIQK